MVNNRDDFFGTVRLGGELDTPPSKSEEKVVNTESTSYKTLKKHNLYNQPNGTITGILKPTTVKIIEEMGDWCKIEQGWLKRSYIV